MLQNLFATNQDLGLINLDNYSTGAINVGGSSDHIKVGHLQNLDATTVTGNKNSVNGLLLI